MREIGGYIELDTYTGSMLHSDGIKLNCGRNALAYLIKAKGIKKIYMPKFMCDSCDNVLADKSVYVERYSIGWDFKPILDSYDENSWIYVVNFYGQLSNEYLGSLEGHIIVDNAQAYFQDMIPGIDTLYTCRKFFGVPDGAILYTDTILEENFPQDESFERMHYLLGRFERPASEFYSEYVNNNRLFKDEPVKRMSKLTENLLCGIDYEVIRNIRKQNFKYLHEKLGKYNKLSLEIPEGAFMYPFYIENGAEIRKVLQKMKIFIPTLWPAVFELCHENELEYDLAKNILPLPVDQRYGIEEMKYLISQIEELL